MKSSVGTTDTQLVLTYNFATAHSVTTTLNLKTLTTELQLVLKTSKLWVKTRTLHTDNRASPTPQIPQLWKIVFFHISRVGKGLFRNSDFGANFCFNSKPSFSFESRRQRIKFPVGSKSRCKHSKNRFRVKTSSRQNIVAITEESV